MVKFRAFLISTAATQKLKTQLFPLSNQEEHIVKKTRGHLIESELNPKGSGQTFNHKQ